jgi:hypothetical protein
MKREMKSFTVTATGTYFVQAMSHGEAQEIVYEALLGRNSESVLGSGEVHYGIKSVEGYHSTIPIGDL